MFLRPSRNSESHTIVARSPWTSCTICVERGDQCGVYRELNTSKQRQTISEDFDPPAVPLGLELQGPCLEPLCWLRPSPHPHDTLWQPRSPPQNPDEQEPLTEHKLRGGGHRNRYGGHTGRSASSGAANGVDGRMRNVKESRRVTGLQGVVRKNIPAPGPLWDRRRARWASLMVGNNCASRNSRSIRDDASCCHPCL